MGPKNGPELARKVVPNGKRRVDRHDHKRDSHCTASPKTGHTTISSSWLIPVKWTHQCSQTVLIKMLVSLLEHVRIFFKPKLCCTSQSVIYKPKRKIFDSWCPHHQILEVQNLSKGGLLESTLNGYTEVWGPQTKVSNWLTGVMVLLQFSFRSIYYIRA